MKDSKSSLSSNQINSLMALYSSGQYEEAIVQIKSLNNLFPNVPLLFNLIGACYKELGQLEGSVQMFKNAINIKEDYAEAHFNLGAVHKLLSRDQDAVESYKKAFL